MIRYFIYLNTRIGDPEKSDRDCEIFQPSHVISTIIIYYIRKIGIIDIILIIIVYNVILFPHWFPDVRLNQDLKISFGLNIRRGPKF